MGIIGIIEALRNLCEIKKITSCANLSGFVKNLKYQIRIFCHSDSKNNYLNTYYVKISNQ